MLLKSLNEELDGEQWLDPSLEPLVEGVKMKLNNLKNVILKKRINFKII